VCPQVDAVAVETDALAEQSLSLLGVEVLGASAVGPEYAVPRHGAAVLREDAPDHPRRARSAELRDVAVRHHLAGRDRLDTREDAVWKGLVWHMTSLAGPLSAAALSVRAMTTIADRVIELRQCTLVPGRRDELVELFDRELVEPQETCGMRVLGQFRDLDDPDRFVWLRSFADMEARRAALAAFYGGPVWAAHRDAANATMVDSDDVLLLRPLRATFDLPLLPRPSPAAAMTDTVVSIDVSLRDDRMVSADDALAVLCTEPAENTFPALPVREGEDVVVRIALGPPPVRDRTALQRLRLAPTSRSALPSHTARARRLPEQRDRRLGPRLRLRGTRARARGRPVRPLLPAPTPSRRSPRPRTSPRTTTANCCSATWRRSPDSPASGDTPP
jgi:hypothetical protein